MMNYIKFANALRYIFYKWPGTLGLTISSWVKSYGRLWWINAYVAIQAVCFCGNATDKKCNFLPIFLVFQDERFIKIYKPFWLKDFSAQKLRWNVLFAYKMIDHRLKKGFYCRHAVKMYKQQCLRSKHEQTWHGLYLKRALISNLLPIIY